MSSCSRVRLYYSESSGNPALDKRFSRDYGPPGMTPSGEFLRAARFDRGWTQKELANRASVSAKYISQLEAGTRRGGPKVWKRLSIALGIEVASLIPGMEQAS